MIYQDQAIEPSRFAVIRWFGLDKFVPEQAFTSHWISSKTFFIIRFILTLYSTIVFWVDVGVTNSGSLFQYFTTLTFVGLHAYQVTILVHHFRYLHTKSVSFFLKQPAFLTYLLQWLYSTVISFNIVTPVVFWAILAKGQSSVNAMGVWLNVSVHGVSFFLMIADVIFNRIKLPIRFVLFPLCTIILYMLMAFVVYATKKIWVYPFLDWSQGGSAAIWYFAVGIICVVAFFIQVLIHWFRDFIARKMGKVEHVEVNEKVNDEQYDVSNKLETESTNVV